MHRVSKIPEIFPEKNSNNLIIIITGRGSTKGFSSLISNEIVDLECISKGQCFPLYVYDNKKPSILFGNQDESVYLDGEYERKYAISDTGMIYFKKHYPEEKINQEDVFYYIYGLLHSEDYRSRYADNLSKELPYIPCVKKIEDFWSFAKAGRLLAKLHLNYETVVPYSATIDTGSLNYSQLGKDDFYVENMKFSKKGEKDTVIYNNKIRIKNIPVEAYDYIVNGKSALEWVMERQGVSTHKDSGIVNDANDWAIETMDNPRYPLELFLRVITVSLETQKIVNSLPKLDI